MKAINFKIHFLLQAVEGYSLVNSVSLIAALFFSVWKVSLNVEVSVNLNWLSSQVEIKVSPKDLNVVLMQFSWK